MHQRRGLLQPGLVSLLPSRKRPRRWESGGPPCLEQPSRHPASALPHAGWVPNRRSWVRMYSRGRNMTLEGIGGSASSTSPHSPVSPPRGRLPRAPPRSRAPPGACWGRSGRRQATIHASPSGRNLGSLRKATDGRPRSSAIVG
jgi:hypothetical protein